MVLGPFSPMTLVLVVLLQLSKSRKIRFRLEIVPRGSGIGRWAVCDELDLGGWDRE